MGKANYLKTRMAIMSTYALFVKLCDRMANIMDMGNLTVEKRNKLVNETIEILDYVAKNRELRPVHIEVMNDIYTILGVDKKIDMSV